MFPFRKSSPEKSIAKLSERFGLNDGDEIRWNSPEAIHSLVRQGHEDVGTYYELTTVHRLTSTFAFPASKFVYLEDGTVCGVIRTEIDPIEENYDEVKSAADFQIDNGLFAPNEQEKQELVGLLKSNDG